jgi:hypothetical protein
MIFQSIVWSFSLTSLLLSHKMKASQPSYFPPNNVFCKNQKMARKGPYEAKNSGTKSRDKHHTLS